MFVKDGRCITWGYNGAPPGLPHCSENAHGWDNEEIPSDFLGDSVEERLFYEQLVRQNGCRNATHAEANALAFAARHGISTDGATLYASVSPCEGCARLLIAAGIRRVVFLTPYRDLSGIALLQEAGVSV